MRASARSSTRSISASKEIPAASAACGSSEVSVEARDRVGLEHLQLAARLVEHQVDAREAVAAEQPVHGERQFLGAAVTSSPSSAGHRKSVRPIS